jgi:hypothetical protein
MSIPLWAWLFSSVVKKRVEELEDRVIYLEYELKHIKRKLREHGIQ